jgi:hypothetical protein
MTASKFDPNQHPAMMLVLEAVASMMMLNGATKDEAIMGASRLFSAAHDEATIYLLECAMARDEE